MLFDNTIFTNRTGTQVKQSERGGRNKVDNLEKALRRERERFKNEFSSRRERRKK
jgi:hypothetical protein